MSAESVLLDHRIAQLDNQTAQINAIDFSNDPSGRDIGEKNRLLADLARQKKALNDEKRIRQEYEENAKVLKKAKQHEALTRHLKLEMQERRLTREEIDQYDRSRETLREALRARRVLQGDGRTHESALALQDRQKVLREKYASLKATNAELYASGTGVAEPCVPCSQNKIDALRKNAEHRRRAIKSKSAFRGQQKNKDTCALMSAASIAIEVNGSAPSEGFAAQNLSSHMPSIEEIANYGRGKKDLIDLGRESGGYKPCNGTTDEAAVLSSIGPKATLVKPASLSAIVDALDSGQGVLVAYDAYPVWYGSDKSTWPDEGPGGHTVRVTGADRAPDGTIRGFWINDSGSGESGKYVDAATMQQATKNFGGGRLAITDSSIQNAVN